MEQERPVIENVQMPCPTTGCRKAMRFDNPSGYDARTGLEYACCDHCGHRGMKAREGVQLLFTAQHDYVFSYGPSLSYLKVVLPTIVLNVFTVQGLTAQQLAAHVAEWALLNGQVCGTVRLAGDFVLSSCYEYCRRQALKHFGASAL